MDHTENSLVKNKGIFYRQSGRDQYLDTYISYIQKYPVSPYKQKKYNLSKVQVHTMNELKDDPDIIIKEADKGSGIVIMEQRYYSSQNYMQCYKIKRLM